VAAASKPHVEIKQNGEHFYIKTSTTVRTTEINFVIGEEFNEETVDGRKCKVTELTTDTGMCINLNFYILLLLPSSQMFLQSFKVVLSNSSLGFPKDFQSFSLDIGCFLMHFQSTLYI